MRILKITDTISKETLRLKFIGLDYVENKIGDIISIDNTIYEVIDVYRVRDFIGNLTIILDVMSY